MNSCCSAKARIAKTFGLALFCSTSVNAQETYIASPLHLSSTYNSAGCLSTDAGSVLIYAHSGPNSAYFIRKPDGQLQEIIVPNTNEFRPFVLKGDVVYGSRQVVLGMPHQAFSYNFVTSTIEDIAPPGAEESHIYGSDEDALVGSFLVNGSTYAGLWRIGVHQFINLGPAPNFHTAAYQTLRNTQVGSWNTFGQRAALWNGSATSFVDLNPLGFDLSRATTLNSTHQFGFAIQREIFTPVRAYRWSGSKESAEDITPDGAVHASISDATDDIQVGSVDFSASVWRSNGTEVLNLGELLPPGYSSSSARIIDRLTGTIYGTARNSRLGRDEAIMWTPVPEPTSLAMLTIGMLSLRVLRRKRS